MSAKAKPFEKVCVIGAGVMGSGIASHLANANVPVLLLDIVPPKHNEGDPLAGSKAFRNKFAASGLANALKSKPASFFTKDHASLVEIGNLDDDIARVKECDWVIEVVVESLPIKQKLFAKLEKYVHADAVVSSNTSGLSIEGMLEGRSDSFKKRFLVTHFFNPVRYLELLELVAGKDTDPAVMERVKQFGQDSLGKGIVVGKDTPNFVANRIGVFGMMNTMAVMMEGGYTLEEVDATFGPAMGRPKSAVFRTADVVGLDTFLHVAANCFENLKDDEQNAIFKSPAWLEKMVAEGYLGQKSGKGFYKKEGKEILALDTQKLKDGVLEYRPAEKVRTESLGAIRNLESLAEKVKTLCWHEDRTGQLAWKCTMASAVYSANRLGEIADDIVAIDEGVKWGFRYEMGPFEAWDALGVKESVERWKKEGGEVPKWVDDMLAAGRTSFYAMSDNGRPTYWDPTSKSAKPIVRDKRVKSLVAIKKDKENVVKNGFSASLVDLGDGVLCCEFTSKMNALDQEIMDTLNEGMDLCEDGKFDALVVANDGANFCVGANILIMYMAAQQDAWDELEKGIKSFQDTMVRLKYSRIPTVAAPFNMTLGGGAEVSMWCNRIRAHAELYMGLVEVGLGLLPGAGGNIEMLARTLENVVDAPTTPIEGQLQRVFEAIAMAKVATSAEEARDMLFLSPADNVTMNRRFLLEAAKQEALGMHRAGFRPPRRRTFRLPGKSAVATFEMVIDSMLNGAFISEHDKKVAMKIAGVLTGGDTTSRVKVSEQHLLDLEREAFLSLCGEEKTQARIAHMLEKNKPLRN
jgi:3-hydroxyacyl-CoA dehydrogenase